MDNGLVIYKWCHENHWNVKLVKNKKYSLIRSIGMVMLIGYLALVFIH